MPFANEHAARIRNPNDFLRIRQLQKLTNGIRILGGPLKTEPNGSTKRQSYRFPKSKFTPKEAREWLRSHDIKFVLFEPAVNNGFTTQMRNEGVADILLYGTVGIGIDGTEVANEIARLNQAGVSEIHEWINSGGGFIEDGWSITAENLKSTSTIHTHNVGTAASMAANILVSGNVRHSFDFAKMMIHEPTLDGKKIEETEDADDKESLIQTKDSIVTHLVNHSSESRDVITKMVEKQTWITASDAKNKHGFIDVIDKTHRKPKNNKEVTENVMLAMCNEYHSEAVNFNHSEQLNQTTMKTVKVLLNLNEDATEKSVHDAVKVIMDDRDKAKNSLETTTSKLNTANEAIEKHKETIKTFEDKQTELNDALVTETVEAAIKDKKFAEKEKDTLIASFKNNLTGLKAVIGAIRTPAVTINGTLIPEGTVSTDIPADRKDWTFRDWDKKDNAGLMKIKNTNRELFNKMRIAEYGEKSVQTT